LNNPNRQVVKGDAYGYNYKYAANVLMLLPSLNFRLIKLTSIWRSLSSTNYQRDGLYKNEFMKRFPLAKARKCLLRTLVLGGILFKISGKKSLNFNGAHLSKAPTTVRSQFPTE
jgi:hypothetical protein